MEICYGCLYPFKMADEAAGTGQSVRSSGGVSKTPAPSADVRAACESSDAPLREMGRMPRNPADETGFEPLDELRTVEIQTRLIERRKGEALGDRKPTVGRSRFILRSVGEEDREFFLPEIEGFTLTIGRSTVNEIIVRDLSVSRRHARLTYREGDFFVEDLNATNFTFLDGIPLLEAHRFKTGEMLGVGTASVLFAATSADAQSSAAAPLVEAAI